MSTEANKIPGMSANDTRRWVIFGQVVLAACVWWALANAVALVYRMGGIPRYTPFGIEDARWIAFALVGAGFIYALRNPVVQEFSNEVLSELRKVTWPTWKETRQTTIVVIITVFIVGMILGGFDFIWAKLSRYVLTGSW